MVLTTDRERLKTLLIETITLLCKNGLDFQEEFSVDALIGITLDHNDVFLISVKETVKSNADDHIQESSRDEMEEQISDVDLHPDYQNADFASSTPLLKSSNCRISFDGVSSAEKDGTQGRLLHSSVLRRKQKTNSSGKSFSGAISPSISNNCLPNVESPLAGDDDVCDLENIIPNVLLQKKDDANPDDLKSLNEEPPRKQQCSISSSPRKNVDSSAFSQEKMIQDIITHCKSEPLDVTDTKNSPADESECSNRQGNSNFLCNAAYGNDGMNWYEPDNLLNPSALPGCSSWPSNALSTSSNGHQDQASGWNRSQEKSQVLFTPRNHRNDNESAGKSRTMPLTHWTTSMMVKKYPYTCTLCGKQVKLLRDLRAHMATKHNLEKDFSCHVCGSQFTYKHNLLCHLRTVHGLK